MTTSMYPLPDDPNAYANGFSTVQGSPLEQRWGGWWVTGDTGGAQHLGNIPVMPAEKNFGRPRNPKAPLASVEGFFDLKGYPAPTSDVVALLVLAHETQMTNLIARARLGSARGRGASRRPTRAARVTRGGRRSSPTHCCSSTRRRCRARCAGRRGSRSGSRRRGRATARGGRSATSISARGCFAYPCSYLIYGEAFDALPPAARHGGLRAAVGRALGPRHAEDHPAPVGGRSPGDPPDPA